jgi:transposase-like protein
MVALRSVKERGCLAKTEETELHIVLICFHCYLHYPLSHRQLEEMMVERPAIAASIVWPAHP